MRYWKSRTVAFIVCFLIGLLAAFIFAALLSRFVPKPEAQTTRELPSLVRCENENYFKQPEDVLTALKSAEVNVRREMFKRLFLRPDITPIYYDYERDLNYPERADRARLEYVKLDDSNEPTALLSFVRLEHPVALVFKKDTCGWHLLAALSSWLRFEDYPYENWLSLPETIKPGVHQLLVRDSTGDSASYLRKARLLKLDEGTLKQIAEIDEEMVEPVAEYHGENWSDVKRRRMSSYRFLKATSGKSAHIEIETTDEVVRLNGSAPAYKYWLETDGTWHARQENWNARPATRVKLNAIKKEELVWNEQERRFVKL